MPKVWYVFKPFCSLPAARPSVPEDHLPELLGVLVLHEEDGLAGLLLHALGARVHAGAAEHSGGDHCNGS